MKKVATFALMLAATLMAAAQYQLPNPGFEQWDGSSSSAEPTNWNSFGTADGSYASMASSTHHYHRNGGRPGTSGSSYLTIYTKSIVGVKANGNMTTGRIHAGALSASSSNNYNYTQRSNSAHCQPFTGTPDSMYVWVSYYAASANSQAQVSAYLHGDNDFRTPNDENNHTLYRATAIARFNRTTNSSTSMNWQQLKVPFVYDGNSSANYMLINLTTNATPGGGDANDSLSIDDIEFIYSAWLTGITVGGTPIPGFSKSVMDYTVHVDNLDVEVDGLTEVDDAEMAIVAEQVDDTTMFVTIDVVAEDNVTTRHYTVTLTTGSGGTELGIDRPAMSENVLKVYPNPATEMVTVDADGFLEIVDMTGRVVLRRPVRGLTRISIAALPSGNYLLRCGSQVALINKL